MPEYGLSEESPEKLQEKQAEEQIGREFIAVLNELQAVNAQARQRKVDAENSSIQSAESLHHLESQIQEIRGQQIAEHEERLRSEKRSTRFQWANIILVALTLLATIIFGLHSCADVPTNGAPQTEFAVSDSEPIELS